MALPGPTASARNWSGMNSRMLGCRDRAIVKISSYAPVTVLGEEPMTASMPVNGAFGIKK
jgi:hypothetical protein